MESTKIYNSKKHIVITSLDLEKAVLRAVLVQSPWLQLFLTNMNGTQNTAKHKNSQIEIAFPSHLLQIVSA